MGYSAEWENFQHAIEPLASAVPWMVTIGNHERDWPNSGSTEGDTDSLGECGVPTLRRFPGMPFESHEPQPKDKPWYALELGVVYLLALSTDGADPVARCLGEARIHGLHELAWQCIIQCSRFERCGLRLGRDAAKGRGRGLYCMRHFEAGDQILAGQAFTVLCPARLWLSRCCVCFLACEDTASGALQPCSKCKAVAFCSQKCADADRWHAWECQAIPDAVRICGQLTHNLADQGSHEKGDLLTELLIVARALRVMHSFPSAFTQRCEDASATRLPVD
ncbi:unnamed protein product [Polarella glacialis]|uniref:MYND-type domain-containing protein n=1 Tax=Polarella glacialis TaxID=89957 RepID=A0A813E3Z8_POLGL|nr:unnamed protein product [Polarella glacialis]